MKSYLLPLLLCFFLPTLSISQDWNEQFVNQSTREIISSRAYSDIDMDGDMDLFTTGFNGTLTWYEFYAGPNAYGKEQTIFNIDGITSSVAFSDLDNDNDIDLLVAFFDKNQIGHFIWVENLDGQGNNWGPIIEIDQFPHYPSSIQVKDLDGDGKQDILFFVANQEVQLQWYKKGNDANSFELQTPINLDSNGSPSFDLVDWDNDNDLDIVSIGYWDGRVAWYENKDGKGNFELAQLIIQLDSPNSIAVNDLDTDGDLDIVAYSPFDNELVWFEQEEQGILGEQQILVEINSLDKVYMADADGDGDLDLFLASKIKQTISLFEHLDGIGTFGPKQIIFDKTFESELLLFVDVDGDQDIDLLAQSSSESTLWWANNEDGKGTFSERIAISTSPTASIIAVGDIDNDGDQDIVSASRGADRIAWYKNMNGQGQMGEQIPIDQLYAVDQIFLEDIDGDQDLDLIAFSVNEFSHAIYTFENIDGKGTFASPKQIHFRNYRVHKIVLSDFDMDNDIDIIIPHNPTPIWLENVGGNEPFILQSPIPTTPLILFDFFAADMDNDNDMDFTFYTHESWGWCEQGPNDLWTLHTVVNNPISTEISYSKIYPADLNGDGNMDMIGHDFESEEVFWHENEDGFGNFGEKQSIETQMGLPINSLVKDIDGDGDQDLLLFFISPINYKHSIVWYENTDGFGNFSSAQEIRNEDGMFNHELQLADMDGDNDLDVITLKSNPRHQFVWLENPTITIMQPSDPAEQIVSVYPNPFNEFATFSIIDSSSERYSIHITNMAGQLLQRHYFNADGILELYRSNLTSGMYIYQVIRLGDNERVEVGKIIVD